MAPLDARWFSGTDNIPELFAEQLEVASFGYPVNAVLGKNGWNGETMAGVGLELTPDNRHIARGQLVMRGPLTLDKALVQAAKLWEQADKDAIVAFSFPNAAEFDFAGGRMTSEYLTSDSVKMTKQKGDVAVQQGDWAKLGIGNFCLRLFVNLTKPAPATGQKPAAKFYLLFFPHTEQEMLDWSDIVKEVGWPGIKILEGDAQLFPLAQEGLWGCPVLPLLCTNTRFQIAPNLPPAAELRHAIAAIMCTARQPNAYASHSTLKRKWGKILADNEEYAERPPVTTWPQMPAPANISGKHGKFYSTSSQSPHKSPLTRTHSHTHTSGEAQRSSPATQLIFKLIGAF